MLSLITGLVLVMGITAIAATSTSAQANDRCQPKLDGKEVCIFNLKRGDVETKNLQIGPFNIDLGNITGGGGNGTVDLTARQMIQNLNITLSEINAQLQNLSSTAITDVGVEVSNATLPE